MDMFHSTLPPSSSRRTHFHAFMEDVHRRIRRIKEAETGTENRTARQIIEDSRSGKYKDAPDPIRQVGMEMAGETRVLCFDEFQVRDGPGGDLKDRASLYRKTH